jgi:hypothetical protein
MFKSAGKACNQRVSNSTRSSLGKVISVLYNLVGQKQSTNPSPVMARSWGLSGTIAQILPKTISAHFT